MAVGSAVGDPVGAGSAPVGEGAGVAVGDGSGVRGSAGVTASVTAGVGTGAGTGAVVTGARRAGVAGGVVDGATTVPASADPARDGLPVGGGATTTTGSPVALPSTGVPDGPCSPSEAAPMATTTNVGTEASATSIPTIRPYRRADPATP